MSEPMSVDFTASEQAALHNLPHSELVDLAVELDILVPAQIDTLGLFGQIVAALAGRAKADGLPLSAYDRDELEALAPAELQALARLCGCPPTVEALIKQGAKSAKRFSAGRAMSPVVLIVPTLLGPLARYAARRG